MASKKIELGSTTIYSSREYEEYVISVNSDGSYILGPGHYGHPAPLPGLRFFVDSVTGVMVMDVGKYEASLGI